jgi:hypothetical protein
MIGRNLNIDNSFRLQIQNASASAFTLNLFNLGGNSNTQTSITTGTLTIRNSALISQLTNGVFTSAATFACTDISSSIIATAIMLPGQTLQDLMNAVNPITDTFGNVGDLFVQATPGDTTGKLYDFNFTLSTIDLFQFSAFPVYTVTQLTTSYVTNNPYVTIDSPTSISFIQNSEIGNVYKIMGMNLYSLNRNQILQQLGYASYDINGNFVSGKANPTVDPYQENGASLLMEDINDFDVSTNSIFTYQILATTEVYLTFNYVKSSLTFMREFNQAFSSELRMKFVTQQKELESLLYRRGILLQ